MNILTNIKVPLILSCTLGLAPFFPKPHLWGKIKWIMGGASGMVMIDWLDLLMHGLPFLWLFAAILFKLKKIKN